MKSFIVSLLLVIVIAGCSGSVDTARLDSQGHFDYAYSLYEEEDYLYAVNEFQSILLQYPGSAVNDDAQYYLGMSYFKREQYLLGAYEFSKLIRDIPASPFVPEAQYMLAESYYQLSPPYQLEQAYTKKAIEEFQAFIDFFPANAKVEECENKIAELNEKLAEKEYNAGYIYERMEYFNAAIKYYQFVVDTYHDTKFAPLALYRKIQIEIQKEMDYEVLKDISLFLDKYPNDPNADKVKQLHTEMTAEG